MFIQAEVRPSPVLGHGLFTLERVSRGKIVCFFALGGDAITEQQYLEGLTNEDFAVMRTGTRYAGKYFTYSRGPAVNTNFINHSFDANLLCHCGIVVARRDIEPGEELTVDYQTLLDTTDIGLYHDAHTGREIRGLSAKDTLLRTAKEFVEIVAGIPQWDGG